MPDDIKQNDENDDINADAKAMLDQFEMDASKRGSSNQKHSKYLEAAELEDQEVDRTKV